MKNIFEYIPFEHDNIEYVNNLINFARNQKQANSPESILAAAVIYTNLVEYLVTHLLKNIKHILHLISYHQMQEIMFILDIKEGHPKNLGLLKNELINYEFPDKNQFIILLTNFGDARNRLFHRLFDKQTQEDINKIDLDIIEMQNSAEEILNKYNVISTGITTSWQKYVNLNLLVDTNTQKV